MQPDPSTILAALNIREPVVGLYDARDPAAFAPLVEPRTQRQCVFATFYVNADQLAVLVTGASYFSGPHDPPVTAPFSSGCGQLAAAIGDLDEPRAVIGATDQAMRQHLDPGLLAFTATKPMFESLCRWADDPKSSLHNNFLKRTIKARGGSF